MSTQRNNIEIVVSWNYTTQSGTLKQLRAVYRYGCQTSPLVFTPNAIAQQFSQFVLNPLMSQLSSAMAFASLTVRLMDDSTQLPVTATFTLTNTGGGITGDSLPIDNAIVFQLKTGLRGKSYRGSKHYGGIPEASTTKDEISAGSLAAWQALKAPHASALTENLNTWVPIVVNGAQSTLTNPTNVVSTVITSAILNKTIGTEKRRKEKTQTA